MAPRELDLNLTQMRADIFKEFMDVVHQFMKRFDDIDAAERLMNGVTTNGNGAKKPKADLHVNGAADNPDEQRERTTRITRRRLSTRAMMPKLREAALNMIVSRPNGATTSDIGVYLQERGLLDRKRAAKEVVAAVRNMLVKPLADGTVTRTGSGHKGNDYRYTAAPQQQLVPPTPPAPQPAPTPQEEEDTPPPKAATGNKTTATGKRQFFTKGAAAAAKVAEEAGHKFSPDTQQLIRFVMDTLLTNNRPMTREALLESALSQGFPQRYGKNKNPLGNALAQTLRRMQETRSIRRRALAGSAEPVFEIIRPTNLRVTQTEVTR